VYACIQVNYFIGFPSGTGGGTQYYTFIRLGGAIRTRATRRRSRVPRAKAFDKGRGGSHVYRHARQRRRRIILYIIHNIIMRVSRARHAGLCRRAAAVRRSFFPTAVRLPQNADIRVRASYHHARTPSVLIDENTAADEVSRGHDSESLTSHHIHILHHTWSLDHRLVFLILSIAYLEF